MPPYFGSRLVVTIQIFTKRPRNCAKRPLVQIRLSSPAGPPPPPSSLPESSFLVQPLRSSLRSSAYRSNDGAGEAMRRAFVALRAERSDLDFLSAARPGRLATQLLLARDLT
ncbi:hypothetical protein PAHAL_3G142400 [Panicum hallii]|uniref:Uncharacterized protein n=1 Tax=Panicum hallii TaxID=206008 RepID=A0A2T8KI53_9POAL|nr:hypothetical protein PAHAL_3G142400 [Panicum hallii]